MDVVDFLPLDFRATLDLLASWAGREVTVTASSQPPGQELTHTQVVLVGVLGEAEMVDNTIDSDVASEVVPFVVELR